MGSGLRSSQGRRLRGGTSRTRTEGFEPKPGVRMLKREEGQALVEFALIAPVFLMIVVGIIYFGIGLNYWLDMNRAANQGARQAVVNHWPPYCLRGAASCDNSSATTPCSAVLATNSRARLQDVIRCQTRNNAAVTICFRGKLPADATVGDPVRVKLTAPFRFFFMQQLGITLTATAAMRLEQKPELITAAPDAQGPTCT
jgi:Flp pilus assembly protein TadG